MQHDLLRPSLDNVGQAAILSTGAIMAAAFFGGTIAVAIVAIMNSLALRRLGRDVPMLLVLVATGAIATWLFMLTLFADMDQVRALKYASRAGGFAAFGVAWLMHRPQLRAISTLGVEPRKPWAPVIAAVLVAIAIQVGIGTALKMAG